MSGKGNHLYLRLADTIIEHIAEGIYAKGSMLPSERELCEIYNVSRTTVRLALQALAQKGYTRSIHGKGTVIVQPQIRQELRSIYSFDEDMRRLGKQSETRIIDFVKMLPTDTIADALSLAPNESVYRIMRLRLADGDPMLLETNYLPCSRFPNMTREALENQSLYRVLTQQHCLNITTAEETFEPVLLRAMESQLFSVEPDTLGMLIERIAYEGERAVEISKSVSPSYKFKPHVVLRA